MHVVFGNMTLDDIDIHGLANLPDQIPKTDCRFNMNDRLAVFGNPHNVKLDVRGNPGMPDNGSSPS